MASGTLAYPRKQRLCGGKWTTNRWKQCQRREWKLRKKLQNCSSWFKRVWLSESKARSVTVIMERAAAALFVFTGPFYALALLRRLERNQWAVSWFYRIRKNKEARILGCWGRNILRYPGKGKNLRFLWFCLLEFIDVTLYKCKSKVASMLN